MANSEFVSMKECRRLLGCGHRQVQRAVESGVLKRIGEKITRASLEELLGHKLNAPPSVASKQGDNEKLQELRSQTALLRAEQDLNLAQMELADIVAFRQAQADFEPKQAELEQREAEVEAKESKIIQQGRAIMAREELVEDKIKKVNTAIKEVNDYAKIIANDISLISQITPELCNECQGKVRRIDGLQLGESIYMEQVKVTKASLIEDISPFDEEGNEGG